MQSARNPDGPAAWVPGRQDGPARRKGRSRSLWTEGPNAGAPRPHLPQQVSITSASATPPRSPSTVRCPKLFREKAPHRSSLPPPPTWFRPRRRRPAARPWPAAWRRPPRASGTACVGVLQGPSRPGFRKWLPLACAEGMAQGVSGPHLGGGLNLWERRPRRDSGTARGGVLQGPSRPGAGEWLSSWVCGTMPHGDSGLHLWEWTVTVGSASSPRSGGFASGSDALRPTSMWKLPRSRMRKGKPRSDLAVGTAAGVIARRVALPRRSHGFWPFVWLRQQRHAGRHVQKSERSKQVRPTARDGACAKGIHFGRRDAWGWQRPSGHARPSRCLDGHAALRPSRATAVRVRRGVLVRLRQRRCRCRLPGRRGYPLYPIGHDTGVSHEDLYPK
jgi:hypothetical protein